MMGIMLSKLSERKTNTVEFTYIKFFFFNELIDTENRLVRGKSSGWGMDKMGEAGPKNFQLQYK